jgi:hypothetical protein
MTDLVPFEIDLTAHELTRLSAVLSACDFDLVEMHRSECEATRMLYSGLDEKQLAIHQQLVEAGVLGGAR